MEMETAWGTWEELVLGGAVLRHGAAAWNDVASEIRSRSRFPHLFSPQECEAKFIQVQKRYSGSETWFEELRKQRVAELKMELEKSDNSIGSLQSKLATLSSSGTETNSHTEITGRDVISSSCKECQSNSDSVCNSQKCEDTIWNWGLQKKRGRRERKREGVTDCEANSSSHTEKQGSTEVGVTESASASVKNEDENVTREDLEVIFKTILENKECSIFQKRLESQKKDRYKKMIRRHVDLQIVSSKLNKGLISSPKELLRDLLLLANNALVFYPKNSPEHNSAIILRNLSRRTLKRILTSSLGPSSSPSEEVEPEEPQIKEEVSVKEENKELVKVMPIPIKEVNKEVPRINKELDKEVPRNNKELDKDAAHKNKELDKEVLRKKKKMEKEVPKKTKESDKEVPSKNKKMEKVVISKTKELGKEVPSKNKKLEKEVTSKSKELDKEVHNKNKELDKDVPSKSKKLEKKVPSKTKELDREVPSKPSNNTRSGKFSKNTRSGEFIRKRTVDRPTRGESQRGAPNGGRKRARR